MLRFNWPYFIAAIAIFIVEIMIALFITDRIIRPYIGDLLVVILMYCFIRAFLRFSVAATAILVLLFAYAVEWLQYLNLLKMLGMQKSKWANIVLGNQFEWIDLVAYILGAGIVLMVEKIRSNHIWVKQKRSSH